MTAELGHVFGIVGRFDLAISSTIINIVPIVIVKFTPNLLGETG